MVLPCPRGPGPSVFTDSPVVEREEIAKKESAVEEGYLGNQEGKGWGQNEGLINGVIFQSSRELKNWIGSLIPWLINSFLFLFYPPSLLPFLPQTSSGRFLGKLPGIVDREEMAGLLPDHGGGFHSGDLSYVTQQDSEVQCAKAGMPGHGEKLK